VWLTICPSVPPRLPHPIVPLFHLEPLERASPQNVALHCRLEVVPPPPLVQRIALGLMHATQVATPFHRPGWVYEEKMDGYRMAAMKTDDGARLISRNGIHHSNRFPALVQALAALSSADFLLDGEIAIYDQALVSRFEWMRARPKDALATEPVYMVFDLLELGGKDLRGMPLWQRRNMLEALVTGQRASCRCGGCRATASRRGRRRFIGAMRGSWPKILSRYMCRGGRCGG